jgi:ATP-dependent RNA helicase DHX8/PRP22
MVCLFRQELLGRVLKARKETISPWWMSIEQLQNAWRRAKNANAKERTMEKALTRWCKENFINNRSLKHGLDVHRLVSSFCSICFRYLYRFYLFELKPWCTKLCKENGSLSALGNHAVSWHQQCSVYCSQIQGHVQPMGLNLSSCGDDMALFRRCLTAAFFLNAAMRQPDGSYR